MSAIAHEVSRRLTTDYAKERASEMARERAEEWKHRATDHPWFVPLVGAGIGALIGKAFTSSAQRRWERDRWDERWFREGTGYPGPRYRVYGGYGEYEPYESRATYRAYVDEDFESGTDTRGDAKERMSAKADEVKDRVREGVDATKERVRQGMDTVRERLPDRETLRDSAQTDTGLWAFGAMALGALFGLALPMSQREREMLEPARRRVREAGEQVKEAALEKGSQAMDTASSRIEEAGSEDEERPSMEHGVPPIAPLH